MLYLAVEQTLHTDSVSSSLSFVGNLAGELGVRRISVSCKICSYEKRKIRIIIETVKNDNGENMSLLETKYSKEETAKLGQEIYEKKVRSEVEGKYENKVVAIDVETGDYAIGKNAIEASRELSKLHKVTDTWFVRVGHRTLHRIANFCLKEKSDERFC
jgi:hypothetical protein